MNQNRILYEDDDILVCHKPVGIATQTARIGQADMVSEMENYLKQGLTQGSRQNGLGDKFPARRGSISHQSQIYVVHRLDQPVEGILVFAKQREAAAALSAQAAGEGMEKEYLALACDLRGKEVAGGQMQSGVLTDYLFKDGKTNLSRVVSPEVKGAKEARLSYEILREELPELPVLAAGGVSENDKAGDGLRCAAVKIRLYTGRHHQIRVQMANAGMPLLGDRKYAPGETAALSERLGIRNVALCAYRLTLIHPKTKERMQFEIKPEGAAFRGIIS